MRTGWRSFHGLLFERAPHYLLVTVVNIADEFTASSVIIASSMGHFLSGARLDLKVKPFYLRTS